VFVTSKGNLGKLECAGSKGAKTPENPALATKFFGWNNALEKYSRGCFHGIL